MDVNGGDWEVAGLRRARRAQVELSEFIGNNTKGKARG